MMQPPIPSGTILKSRYRLDRVLGQGGFGRTYLAEDQGRFNERCVVKEYIPVQGSDYSLQKSKELFQREAAVLYQIEHPQIPKFREMFEQGRRLFFVQDFIDGRTYRSLLEERLAAGMTFSEAEVMHLMEQVLPVLAYIHSKGIVHRDISPDNLILREGDRLPVLIDFGVVKEVAGQLHASEVTQQGTTVGKLGYSPSEQLQTGKVYPNSDLYALAVTVVVLLTGKQPQDLLDETTMTWHWQQWVPALSPRLVQVLNRMMNPRPHNRYESATEVLQALRSLTGLVESAAAPGTQVTKPVAPAPQPTSVKPRPQIKTITASTSSKPVGQPPTWLGWAIAGGVLLVVAIAPWIVLSNLLKDQAKQRLSPTPNANVSPVPSPTIVPSPAATPPVAATPPTTSPSTPTPTDAAVESVTFGPNQSTVQKSGTVSLQRSKQFIISLAEGQSLSVQVIQGTVTLEVRDPIGVILASNTASWQSQPSARAGNYQITVSSLQETPFSVVFTLTGGNPTATPQPIAPTPTVTPSSPTVGSTPPSAPSPPPTLPPEATAPPSPSP
ncbi:MAG: protein kinase [Cyanobacteria bacterium]|nr:protein kinase [Cyanobacteriota bacterium]MDW8201312.1 protein kinase [Cyanobacteriota bacterium SKYGB_h_bin112]